MTISIRPEGPIPARIMLVGDTPGEWEERRNQPFAGPDSTELNRMLAEAGINRNECFLTYVNREPTPFAKSLVTLKKKEITSAHSTLHSKVVSPSVSAGWQLLQKELSFVQPQVIIALGDLSLLALTTQWGIDKWRGSMLRCGDFKVIPTYHPRAVLTDWSLRSVVVSDLRRAARFRNGGDYPDPRWQFIVRPTFDQARGCLQGLLEQLERGVLRLSFDIETRRGHIACAGLSWSLREAICIPFMCMESREGYWLPDEEAYLIWLLYQCLTHNNAQVVGQNILYDSQYTWRHWHFVPRVTQDTMIAQHSLFADMPKSLAFQASMYTNYYSYWKDEGKDWAKNLGEDQLWRYNCQDCVYTDEAGQTELKMAAQMKLEPVYEAQQRLFWPVLRAMQLGVRIDPEVRKRLTAEVKLEVKRREEFIQSILGHPFNPKSSKQMMTLFYSDLNQPVIMTRAKKGVPARPTLNDEALQQIASREPLLKPLVNAICDIRTMGIFLSSYLEADLDYDGRMRCAYNIGGSASGKSAPVTYRLSSGENAFGNGANLQTIPSEKSKSLNKAAQRGPTQGLGKAYDYPNLRSMFIPDPGHTFFNGDLDRADLQVVVWESNDEMLKAALRMGADIHLLNAFVLEGTEPPSLDELVERHKKHESCSCLSPRCYWDYRTPRSAKREFAKTFCHGTNYGGKPRTMAAHTGRTVHEIDRAQKLWFGAHPGIEQWQNRIKLQCQRYRFVENKFGYRWYIFDRIDSIIPQAIAWIPQSTVSIVINRIWQAIYDKTKEIQVLLQVHDSLAGQFPTAEKERCVSIIRDCAKVVVPYQDPLVIPFSLETSEVSWGDC